MPKLQVPHFASYTHFGGRSQPYGTLHNVMRAAGIRRPDNHEPYSEALLMLIGGGAGFGYRLLTNAAGARLRLGVRCDWASQTASVFNTLLHLGLDYDVQNYDNEADAGATLLRTLEAQRPALLWLDRSLLPYAGGLHSEAAIVGLAGFDGELVTVDDHMAEPQPVSLPTLNAARSGRPSAHYRLVRFGDPKVNIDLNLSVMMGLQRHVLEFFTPHLTDTGHLALDKWLDRLLGDHPKSWLQVLDTEEAVYDVLCAVYTALEGQNNDGHALRLLFADGLTEAAEIMGEPQLLDVAFAYRESAKAWHELAETALSDQVPALHEAKELINYERYLRTQPDETHRADSLSDVRKRQQHARQAAAESFTLKASTLRDILANLRYQLLLVQHAEENAGRLLVDLLVNDDADTSEL